MEPEKQSSQVVEPANVDTGSATELDEAPPPRPAEPRSFIDQALHALALLSVVFVVYFIIIHSVTGPEDLTVGTVGDAFGSINAFAASAALIAIVYTIHLQRLELAEQRYAVELQRYELRLQRREMQLQREEMVEARRVFDAQRRAADAQAAAASEQLRLSVQPIVYVKEGAAILYGQPGSAPDLLQFVFPLHLAAPNPAFDVAGWITLRFGGEWHAVQPIGTLMSFVGPEGAWLRVPRRWSDAWFAENKGGTLLLRMMYRDTRGVWYEAVWASMIDAGDWSKFRAQRTKGIAPGQVPLRPLGLGYSVQVQDPSLARAEISRAQTVEGAAAEAKAIWERLVASRLAHVRATEDLASG